MRIAVIIPTYNEAGAVGALIDELAGVFASADRHEWLILVVDGNSTDGTADIVKEKMRHYPNISLLEEPEKRGIALAYMTGIRHAIDTMHAAAFMEFDGDGQHDPRDIPRLAAKMDEGFDYVIGSRYVAGGSVPANWKWYRKFLSRFGSLYARFLMEWSVKDVTSGFKLTRVTAFKAPERLLSRHYAYKIHLLASMLGGGAKVAEVPIAFRMREYDASKSTWKDIVESLKVTTILRMRSIKKWRMAKVLFIGGLGAVWQIIIFNVLAIWTAIVSPSTATVIGAEVAIINNFVLNERFTFNDVAHQTTSLFHRVFKFHLVSSGSLATQWICILVAEHISRDPLFLNAAFILGVGVGFIINYTGYYFFVWRKE